MLGSHLLMGRYTVVEVVHRSARGEYLRASREGGETALVLLAPDAIQGLRERRLLRLLACPGIPKLAPDAPSAGPAVPFLDAENAAPLAVGHSPGPSTLRAGLGEILSVLSHVHGRGQESTNSDPMR